MGDLAPRPRGGWQVGGLRPPRPPGLSDVVADPAPDCYSVARVDGGFVVKHFPSREATTPCCVLRVDPKPGESDIDALARASRHCDRKHGGA